jgi:frataxin-like iron-binding protein CyaY
MTDADYHRLAFAALSRIEATLDGWLQSDVIDIDSQRTGGLLELTMPTGSKIVVNTQPPLQELSPAATTSSMSMVSGATPRTTPSFSSACRAKPARRPASR